MKAEICDTILGHFHEIGKLSFGVAIEAQPEPLRRMFGPLQASLCRGKWSAASSLFGEHGPATCLAKGDLLPASLGEPNSAI